MCSIFRNILNKLVGTDEFGNKYYVSRFKKDYLGRETRFVIYKGKLEPSKVPAMWHSWLHHLSDEAIKDKPFKWQKPHLPNLTGTKLAYVPGKFGVRHRVSADFNIWFPWGKK